MMVWQTKYLNTGMERWQSVPLAVYFAVWLFLLLLYLHPVYLAGLGAALLLLALSQGLGAKARQSLIWTMPMVILFLLINTLVSGQGCQTLFHLPSWAGGRPIYKEALIYSLAMGLKLADIVVLFVIINRFFGPHRLIDITGGRLNKPVLVLALALRMIPCLMQEIGQIRDTFRMRGTMPDTKKLTQVNLYLPFIRAAVTAALDGSAAWAEALQVRGYGCGPRSHYFRGVWGLTDHAVMIGAFLALIGAIVSYLQGWGQYDYYQGTAVLHGDAAVLLIMEILFLLLPATLIDEGFKGWPLSKSRN